MNEDRFNELAKKYKVVAINNCPDPECGCMNDRLILTYNDDRGYFIDPAILYDPENVFLDIRGEDFKDKKEVEEFYQKYPYEHY